MSLSTLPIHELAALATALCWAATSLISAGPAAHLGPFAFNRLRQIAVTAFLALVVTLTGRWAALAPHDLTLLLLSGLVGIFVGDTLLFTALNRLGPRRSGVVFALNAPMTAILGWLLLGEALSLSATAGIALSALGVMLAIGLGGNTAATHRLEQVKGSLLAGVGFGLCAALGQALGSIIARPVMQAGFDPVVASMLRVGAAAASLTVLMALPLPVVQPRAALTWRMATLTILSGLLAMGLGMTLLLFALQGGQAGIVSTLSATSPVMILPLIWLRTGQRPSAWAWAGALLVVAGMALIFVGH